MPIQDTTLALRYHHQGQRKKLTLPLESGIPNNISPWKRFQDISIASLALVLLSPIYLLEVLYIKLTSSGPVIFRQVRIGRQGRPFICLKFRTMKLNCETSSHHRYVKELIHQTKVTTKLDMRSDPRLLPGAKYIRAAGLDELPQLVNVLRGEMSIVGPRPCLPYEAEEYDAWHKARFDVLPGLTGLWQVSGKNRTTFAQMVRLDISYAHRWTFWYDLFILLKTLPAVLIQVNTSITKPSEGESS
jgi:lipopolysaccharide/colanic/teichoic acid biosynthesis glycosyltransferase